MHQMERARRHVADRIRPRQLINHRNVEVLTHPFTDCWSLSSPILRRIGISIALRDSILTSRLPQSYAGNLVPRLATTTTRHGNAPTRKILLILIKRFSYWHKSIVSGWGNRVNSDKMATVF